MLLKKKKKEKNIRSFIYMRVKGRRGSYKDKLRERKTNQVDLWIEFEDFNRKKSQLDRSPTYIYQ